MVYRFIATTLFNGNKRLTMHSYREQMRNHNGRQYHLQSGIGRQATGNIGLFTPYARKNTSTSKSTGPIRSN